MHLRKRNRTWYASVFINGAWVERSTRCSSRDAAERVARGWERDAADPGHAARQKVTLGDVLGLVIERTETLVEQGKRSVETLEFYRKNIGHWTRLFELRGEGDQAQHVPLPLGQFNAASVDWFIEQRRSEGASEHTIHKNLVPARLGFRLAVRRKWWTGNVGEIFPVAFSPQYEPRKRHLSVEEVNSLCGLLLPYQAARVAFMVATGAEWSATERARRDDVADDLGRVHVRGSKNDNRDRTTPIVLDVCKLFLAYALEHGERGELLFRRWTNVRRDLIEACTRAKIPPCSPNDLRRTFGHWLLQAGVTHDLIGASLGHADSKMAKKVYAKAGPEELEALLLKAVQKVPVSAGHLPDAGQKKRERKESMKHRTRKKTEESMPRGGIEPPTRGFSVPVNSVLSPRDSKVNRSASGRFAGHLPDENRPARITKAGTKRRARSKHTTKAVSHD